MRAPESLIPVLEQLCTVLEQLCQVEADKLTVISADHPDQLESLLNDENMLLLQFSLRSWNGYPARLKS